MSVNEEERKEQFKKIYDETYNNILRYIIIKTSNINEVNDIIQETYLELWNILKRRVLREENLNSFMIGIANNKIKKHYTFLKKLKFLIKDSSNKDIEDIKEEKISLEELNIKKEEWDSVWRYLKTRKNQDIPKIYYLYYVEGINIKEIALVLKVRESYVKNLLYRTLKELKRGDYYAK